MHLLPLSASLLLPLVFAKPLTIASTQSFDLNTLTIAPTTNTTALGAEIGCFKQTKSPPFIATNKPDCEAALDSWVRGESLIQPRTFGRSPSGIYDVLLPLEKVSGSCLFYMNMINEDDEDTLTLAEIYAELLGPDGLMKNCLGQKRLPAIGGRMSLGPKGVLKVMITGAAMGVED